ncbi:MAG: fibro-slime domain-containing protein, partial [Phocaeicola sp.]
GNGYYNYNYVKGTASSLYGGVDLATALRNRITGGLGNYADTKSKNLIGTWTDCQGYIKTYYDAAYFLLNNLFVPGSYNEPQSDYKYLVLSKATTTNGKNAYIFDAGFTDSTNTASAKSSVKYDTVNKTISNSSAAAKTMYTYEGTAKTTLYPFLPVTAHNNEAGETKSPYFLDPGVANTDAVGGNYNNRDFNYVMQSTGEFVYHADDDLFFEFEGDDDVYLFINGQLVMDIGGAHGITAERFNLNTYVEAAKANVAAGSTSLRDQALNLQEGQNYSFDFYYMERHGYGANMRIVTNIHVTDPEMKTEKVAYQNEKQLDYGSIVDKMSPIEYGFKLTNSGNANLTDLTFRDDDIGIAFNYTNGMELTGSRIYRIGGTAAVSSVTDIIGDIRAIVTDESNTVLRETTFSTNDELKSYLDTIALAPGQTIEIRGFAYKLSDTQISAGVFDNQVFTTATDGTHPLSGSAQMRVFVPSDPMYYEWKGHDLKIDIEKLVEDVLAAAQSEDNILHDKVPNLTNASQVTKVETCISTGSPVSNDYVSVGTDKALTVNYPTT